MLKEKKGVLATRSPHRPNPVGVTLARVEKIDKKTRSVLLSACDLVQGTPVLDIKPYVPNYDSVEPCRVPSWIVETINTRNEVIISQKARDSVMDRALHSKFKLYKNDPELFLKGAYVPNMSVLTYVVQCSAVQRCAVLCCAVHFCCWVLKLFCLPLHITLLFAVHCTVLHCVVSHPHFSFLCFVLYCIVSYRTFLHCTVLYSFVSYSFSIPSLTLSQPS